MEKFLLYISAILFFIWFSCLSALVITVAMTLIIAVMPIAAIMVCWKETLKYYKKHLDKQKKIVILND